MPKHNWDRRMSRIRRNGNRMARRMREQDQQFILRVLAPKVMLSEDSVPLGGAVIDLDWKVATKLEMVKSARDMITNAYTLGSLDPGFPTILRSVIEGKGLYEHSVGEFFQLYGQFEGMHQLTRGSMTKAKMEDLIDGDERYVKCYRDRGKWHLYPLPYAVRNILAHTGQNPNTLDQDGKELRISIELLRSWVSHEE